MKRTKMTRLALACMVPLLGTGCYTTSSLRGEQTKLDAEKKQWAEKCVTQGLSTPGATEADRDAIKSANESKSMKNLSDQWGCLNEDKTYVFSPPTCYANIPKARVELRTLSCISTSEVAEIVDTRVNAAKTEAQATTQKLNEENAKKKEEERQRAITASAAKEVPQLQRKMDEQQKAYRSAKCLNANEEVSWLVDATIKPSLVTQKLGSREFFVMMGGDQPMIVNFIGSEKIPTSNGYVDIQSSMGVRAVGKRTITLVSGFERTVWVLEVGSQSCRKLFESLATTYRRYDELKNGAVYSH